MIIIFRKVLLMNLKHSKQRDSIKEFLEGRKDHPTADMVYMNVRKTFPNISLGTVYRNLSLLSEIGEIQKISSSNGPDRFDGNPKPHFHFFCRKCGQVTDIPCKYPIDFQSQLHDFGGMVEEESIQFFGICETCLKKLS